MSKFCFLLSLRGCLTAVFQRSEGGSTFSKSDRVNGDASQTAQNCENRKNFQKIKKHPSKNSKKAHTKGKKRKMTKMAKCPIYILNY